MPTTLLETSAKVVVVDDSGNEWTLNADIAITETLEHTAGIAPPPIHRVICLLTGGLGQIVSDRFAKDGGKVFTITLKDTPILKTLTPAK